MWLGFGAFALLGIAGSYLLKKKQYPEPRTTRMREG